MESTLVSELEFDLLHALAGVCDLSIEQVFALPENSDFHWSFQTLQNSGQTEIRAALQALSARGLVRSTPADSPGSAIETWAPSEHCVQDFWAGRIRTSDGPAWKRCGIQDPQYPLHLQEWSKLHPGRQKAAKYWRAQRQVITRLTAGEPAYVRAEGQKLRVPLPMIDMLSDLADEDTRRLYEVFPHVRKNLQFDGLHRQIIRTSMRWLEELHDAQLVELAAEPSYPDTIVATWADVSEWMQAHEGQRTLESPWPAGPELSIAALGAEMVEQDRIHAEPEPG